MDLDFETDPAADFLNREREEFAGITNENEGESEMAQIQLGLNFLSISMNHHHSEPMFNPEDFELINNEIKLAEEQSNDLADDLAGMTFNSTIPETSKFDDVPEKIKLWRQNFAKNLEEKDERVRIMNNLLFGGFKILFQEQREKEALREAAQKEMDDWVSKYNSTIEKSKTVNRSNELDEPEVASPTDADDKNMWESITKLCDFTGKGPKNTKDASRMRSIFVHMKASPKVN